jgi:hypothetical protein
MSIRDTFTELQSIKTEMKRLKSEIKTLREAEKKAEYKIREYLMEKGEPGFKLQGTAVILEEKEIRTKKNNKEKNEDALYILEKYGITENKEKILNELLEARKGDLQTTKKLKIQKFT